MRNLTRPPITATLQTPFAVSALSANELKQLNNKFTYILKSDFVSTW